MNTAAALSNDDDLVLNTTARAIDEAIAAEAEAAPPRGHLGMSQIGEEDARKVWLKFRWSLPDEPAPRVQRIFRLGNIIEIEIARLLRMVPGVTLHEVDPETGEQFRYSYIGGHFGGSMDGAVVGVPEAPKTWHVWEAKSVNGDRFKELVKQGVKSWSPEYYGQLQCYMGASGMTRALFTAYNKDTSEIYIERVKPEPMYWESAQVKAERIIEAKEPPPSTYPKREYYKARFMSDEAQAVYWGDRLPPRPSCRNCRFAQPVMTGNAAWYCHLHGREIGTVKHQLAGCTHHNWIPALMPAKLVQLYDDCAEYVTTDGVKFFNAPRLEAAIGVHVYDSWELSHVSKIGLKAETLGEEFITTVRSMFGARIDEVTV